MAHTYARINKEKTAYGKIDKIGSERVWEVGIYRRGKNCDRGCEPWLCMVMGKMEEGTNGMGSQDDDQREIKWESSSDTHTRTHTQNTQRNSS